MPITKIEINRIVGEFNPDEIYIGIFASHSGKPLGICAREAGFKTVLVAEKGRESLYTIHNRHLYDEILVLKDFKDILNDSVQKKLRKLNTIFVPNRSLYAYVGYDGIENEFEVPMYVNRFFPGLENRNKKYNQYAIMDLAKIKRPEQFPKPEKIDRKVIVKIQQSYNPLERYFFSAENPEDFNSKLNFLLKEGVITEKEIRNAIIEEFIEDDKYNANFQVYGLKDIFGEFDFVGTSDRRQLKKTKEESGHIGVTARESYQPMFYKVARKLISFLSKEKPPGVIGPLGIQGAFRANPKTLEPEFLTFDLSFRVTGDNIMGPTSPEMRNLSLKYKRKIEDPLDLVMMEIKEAARIRRLDEIVT